MSYTPVKQQPHTDLDNMGMMLGLPRLKDESLSDYRRRLIGETTTRSGPTQRDLIKTLSRRVGVFDLPVFDISLIEDVDGVPLATNPMIEITSSWLRAYPVVGQAAEIEINFYDREDGMFLLDVVAAFSTSTYFTLTTLDDYQDYLVSRNLQFGSSLEYVDREILADSIENKLQNGFVSQIIPNNPQIFVTEVESLVAVDAYGKYYVDYQNGVIFTFSTMGGLISYYYNKFPYRIFWQQLKTYPYGDDDKRYFHRKTIVDDSTREDSYELLNSKGVTVANLVYSVHPIAWGE